MDAESNTTSSINESDQALVTVLNALIHLCHDAHDGYMQAADSITSSAYKTVFAEYALQRSRFATQLANLVLDHGGDPDDDGHAMSMFQRGWSNIGRVLMGSDYGAILAECERSEDLAKSAYERTLKKPLAKDAEAVISQQYGQIIDAHNRIRDLRDDYYTKHQN
jgi:uncharacterized protein (TIGR02284 family)